MMRMDGWTDGLTLTRARTIRGVQGASTDVATPLRAYVEETFSASGADACGEDFGEAQRLRDAAAEACARDDGGATEALRGYYRALCAMESRIPISASAEHAVVEFSWRDSGRGARASPRAVTRADVQYEKCAVLYNYAAALSRSGARLGQNADAEGVKRAAAAFQASAGAFEMLADVAERKLSGGAPSVDLSREHCDVMIKLQLAQAQECFFLKAKIINTSAIPGITFATPPYASISRVCIRS